MKRLAGFFFGLLLVLMGCTTAGERARMRAGLDSINTRNRNDQPFTAQDVEPYVRFFDRYAPFVFGAARARGRYLKCVTRFCSSTSSAIAAWPMSSSWFSWSRSKAVFSPVP